MACNGDRCNAEPRWYLGSGLSVDDTHPKLATPDECLGSAVFASVGGPRSNEQGSKTRYRRPAAGDLRSDKLGAPRLSFRS